MPNKDKAFQQRIDARDAMFGPSLPQQPAFTDVEQKAVRDLYQQNPDMFDANLRRHMADSTGGNKLVNYNYDDPQFRSMLNAQIGQMQSIAADRSNKHAEAMAGNAPPIFINAGASSDPRLRRQDVYARQPDPVYQNIAPMFPVPNYDNSRSLMTQLMMLQNRQ